MHSTYISHIEMYSSDDSLLRNPSGIDWLLMPLIWNIPHTKKGEGGWGNWEGKIIIYRVAEILIIALITTECLLILW